MSHRRIAAALATILTLSAGLAQAQSPVPSFSKSFAPDTVGPGSSSVLTFMISNSNATGVTDLAFVDNLPAGLTVQGGASQDCDAGDLTAPAGGSTITFANGQLGPNDSCTLVVEILAGTTPGPYSNVSGDLTSSAGNSGTASDDLVVTGSLPGFSKSFSPGSIPLGGTSTLTFLIDNTAGGDIANLDFTDTLHAGLVVESPANASTDCEGPLGTTLTAIPGSSTIVLDADGSTLGVGNEVLAAGDTCTVSVDVRGAAAGSFFNSVALLSDFTLAGNATDTLTVTASPSDLSIIKEFTDDPTFPGGTVTLEFEITNLDRSFPATGIGFTDNLTGLTTGITYDSLLFNDCGGTVGGVGGTLISFSGGTLGSELTCTIRVSLAVAASATPGTYTNTTSPVTGDINGSGVVGNTAANDLTIVGAQPLIFTKSFLTDPVGTGSDTTLRFRIENPNPVNGGVADATDIAFTDHLTAFLPQTVGVSLPAAPCNGGSMIVSAIPNSDDRTLVFSGGSVDEGAFCEFDVILTIPADSTAGTFTNTTSTLSADLGTAGPVGSPPATDMITIVGGSGLSFSKEFLSDPVDAGDTTTLRFTLENLLGSGGDATGVTFTDDLAAMLAGTTALGLPIVDPCGTGGGTVAGSAGDSLLTASGITLTQGVPCSFDVTVQIDAGASGGTFTNTTSSLTGTISGVAVSAPSASDTVTVFAANAAAVELVKEFIDDPALPGQVVTARFTLTNPNTDPGGEATAILFTDPFSNMGLGLTSGSFGAIAGNTCSVSPVFSGTTLIFSGASLGLGASCSFDVPITIPSGALPDMYPNITSSVSATISGTPVVGAAGIDQLEVQGDPLTFTKSLPNNPVLAGDIALLEFTITNTASTGATNIAFTDDLDVMLSGAQAVSANSNNCGGMAAALPAGLFDYSGGSLAAGASCTISLNLQVPAGASAGLYPNTTSPISADFGTATGIVSSAASDDLRVTTTTAPDFEKTFSPDSVVAGETTTLNFTITNTSATDTLSRLGFTDDLEALIPGVTIASFPADPCGAGSTLAGTSPLSLANGTLGGGESCSFSVDLQIPATATPGDYDNVTSDLIDGATGGALQGPALDTLTIIARQADLRVVLSDSPDPVDPGAALVYTVTVSNDGPQTAENVVSTFTLPANVTLVSTSGCAEDPNGVPTCSLGDIANGGSAVYTINGTVSPAANADLTANVAVAGTTLDPNPGNNAAAEITTVVPTADIAVTKDDGRPSVTAGDTLTYTMVVSNNGPFDDPSVSLTDTIPAPLSCTYSTSATTGGATTSPGAGAGDIAETLAMPAGSTAIYLAVCQVDINFTGLLQNTAAVTGSLTDPNPANNSATDDTDALAPTPLVFTKAFDPDTIAQGETSVLRLTIDNSANPFPVTAVAFTDDFAASGVIVADPPAASDGCGGSFAPAAGDTALSYSGGTVGANASCIIEVTVQGLLATTFANATSTLTSSLPSDTAAATASLRVNPNPLDLALQFGPNPIEQGQITTLTYTLTNNAPIDATGITMSDTLPDGLNIAFPEVNSTTCGGTVMAVARSRVVDFSGGALASGASCTIMVALTSVTPGDYPNSAEGASSSLGDSTSGSDTLTVNGATFGNVTIVQQTDEDGTFDFASAEPALTFSITTSGGLGTQGPITLDVGTYTVTQTPPAGVGNMSITCDDANSSGDPATGIITIQLESLENVTCTIVSISSLQKTIDTNNRFMTLRGDLILSSEPRSDRRFGRLNNGFGTASRFTWSPGDLKALLPFSAQIAPGARDYRFSTSMLQVREAAAAVALAHGSTKNAVYVDNYRFDAWFEAQYKQFDGEADRQGHFAIAYMGVDYLATTDMLVGVMLQVDDMEDLSASAATTARGTGWMFGPYMTARVAPNLYFDGRLAAGRSTNEVSPFNTYVDEFTTDRWLAMASLTGEFQQGPWTIRPAASLSYFEETQASYVDSLGVTIPGQTVRLGQLKLGPTFSGRFETEDGMLFAPYVGVDAIYNLGETLGVTVTNPSSPSTEGWRGRLQAGIDFTTETGARISFGGTYDGLFREDFDTWGLQFDVTIPLHKNKAR